MTPAIAPSSAAVDAAALPFVGEWVRLVSTTNWEKGRIVARWRKAMIAAGAQPREYTDEVWASHVGHVSPQHVGRLRRTYERFGDNYRTFDGLFWSHFQLAVDWADAEVWLSAASQRRWSVAMMRDARNQSLGITDEKEIEKEPIVTAEYDEDATGQDRDDPIVPQGEAWSVEDVKGEEGGSSSEDAPFDSAGESSAHHDAAEPEPVDSAANRRVRPFENLPPLPTDLADLVENFKLAIVHHRVSGWSEVPREVLLEALDALKALATAPSDGER